MGREEVASVSYLGALDAADPRHDLVRRQCSGAGSTLSFTLEGGRPAAFAFLDALKVVKQAVSLGGTESLACHPASTTHSGLTPAERADLGIGEGMVRLSVGIEAADDILADLDQALAAVARPARMAASAAMV
jgi:methionine-gamma-lyase